MSKGYEEANRDNYKVKCELKFTTEFKNPTTLCGTVFVCWRDRPIIRHQIFKHSAEFLNGYSDAVIDIKIELQHWVDLFVINNRDLTERQQKRLMNYDPTYIFANDNEIARVKQIRIRIPKSKNMASTVVTKFVICSLF